MDTTGWTYGEPTTGTVVRTVFDKGFVFVRAGDVDYFLHHSNFDGELLTLKEKTVVRFTPTETPKGPRATAAERVR